ncbi:DUF92 domain-containing protein [Cytobacillus gottheilii]|uniref:DUF92 domain-containing protein n=1 Tax=Cytobacillus gottheilii TaxID=859144 RepID=UPI0021475FB1|nr:DUF92 domain-containing protein [Cytobacillus gottheilii]
MILTAAFGGYRLKVLSLSGAFSACIVGISVGLGFGFNGLIILGMFFLTSSLWSNYKKQKKAMIEEIVQKGANRDWQQVLANGGVAAGASLLYWQTSAEVWLLAFFISIASANSDTWASEIGSLSKKAPVYIRTLKPAPPGTSGAVSLLGTIAGIAGSFVISFTALSLFDIEYSTFLLVFLFGFAGNLVDTLLGAYVQAVYVCPVCGKHMEKIVHCQVKTTLQKGKAFFTNDVVNFLSGFIAVILGFIYFQFTNG